METETELNFSQRFEKLVEGHDISPSASLVLFLHCAQDEIDKRLTGRYDELKEKFILRRIFTMGGKKYLGLMQLSMDEAVGMAEYILETRDQVLGIAT